MMTETATGRAKLSRTTIGVVAICWVTIVFDGYDLIVFDGYDLIVFGAVVPTLLEYPGWDLTPAKAGVLGSYVLIGMLIGALIAGTITDIIGRRKIILFCIVWFSIGMGLPVVQTYGWRPMFWIGMLPLVLIVPLAWKFMPESIHFLVARGRLEEAEEAAPSVSPFWRRSRHRRLSTCCCSSEASARSARQ